MKSPSDLLRQKRRLRRKKITPKDFATLHAGKKAYVNELVGVGRIVGYTDKYVYLEARKELGVKGIKNIIKVVDIYDDTALIGCGTKLAIIPEAYPHKCKVCKSPARVCGSLTICSNLKCATIKSIHKFNAKFPATRYPRHIKCPTCNMIANNARGIKYNQNTPMPFRRIMICPNKHKWELELQTGDMICMRNRDMSFDEKINTWTYI